MSTTVSAAVTAPVTSFSDSAALKAYLTDPKHYKCGVQDACNICQDEFDDEAPIKMPCGHVFGVLCIEQWLSAGGKGTCPMCRAVLYDEPVPDLVRDPAIIDGDVIVFFDMEAPPPRPRRQQEQLNLPGLQASRWAH